MISNPDTNADRWLYSQATRKQDCLTLRVLCGLVVKPVGPSDKKEVEQKVTKDTKKSFGAGVRMSSGGLHVDVSFEFKF